TTILTIQMYLIGLALLVVGAAAQMQPQCLCSEFNPCFAGLSGAVQACAERCQSSLTELGASFAAARQCIAAHQAQIQQTVTCARNSFGNVCANAPGQMVPRHFPETFQLAAFREVNQVLARSGVLAQAAPLLSAGRKAVGCMMRCGQQNNCVKRGCGLALPSDNVAIHNVKNCAMQAGFTTPTVREMCNCLANAGIRQLAPLCPRLVIS
ncbi:hypothetical protein PMAYCL1PPCAC_32759, partial [Pristionchus mayeri]